MGLLREVGSLLEGLKSFCCAAIYPPQDFPKFVPPEFPIQLFRKRRLNLSHTLHIPPEFPALMRGRIPPRLRACFWSSFGIKNCGLIISNLAVQNGY